MGILNVTPDSFSDGGLYSSMDAAIQHGLKMIAEGADIIDIGGESTRPYADPISIQEELDRVIPIIESLRPKTEITLSVDTSKPEVIKAAIDAGAEMINDVRALSLSGALTTITEHPKAHTLSICLAHMPAEPPVMQDNPHYENVTQEVYAFLEKRIQACLAAGLNKNQLVADPGFGFGKTTVDNFQVLNQLDTFKSLDLPILVGLSRKACMGATLNQPVTERLYGSLAAAVLAVSKGANIIRCHDVKATREAITITEAILNTPHPALRATFPREGRRDTLAHT